MLASLDYSEGMDMQQIGRKAIIKALSFLPCHANWVATGINTLDKYTPGRVMITLPKPLAR